MKKLIVILISLFCLCSFTTISYAADKIHQSGNWEVSKHIDDMTDEVSYMLLYYTEEFVFAHFSRDKRWLFRNECVLDSGNIKLRVDKNPSIEVIGDLFKHRRIYMDDWNFTNIGDPSASLVNQMKNGTSLLIRVYNYGSSSRCDSIVKLDLTGFTAAYNEFQKRAQ